VSGDPVYATTNPLVIPIGATEHHQVPHDTLDYLHKCACFVLESERRGKTGRDFMYQTLNEGHLNAIREAVAQTDSILTTRFLPTVKLKGLI
jgi:hypothetical protein